MENFYKDIYNFLSSKNGEKTLNSIFDWEKDYAKCKGLIFKEFMQKNSDSSLIPFTLLPTPFPAELMKKARRIEESIQLMLYSMSRDTDFINNILKNVVKYDSFTGRLLEIMNKVDFRKQIATIAIIRSDYMINKAEETLELKQVEINTVSPSYCGQAETISKLHTQLLSSLPCYLYQSPLLDKQLEIFNQKKSFYPHSIEKNKVLNNVCECILKAYKCYLNVMRTDPSKTCIVFAVQKNERNCYDQLKIKYRLHKMLSNIYLHENYTQVPCIHILTLEYLQQNLSFNEKTNIISLYIEDIKASHEVGVVYFRCFYTPNDIIDDETWKLRLIIEQSSAIKIPNIATQLIGSKKFQQVLANFPELVSTYLSKGLSLYEQKNVCLTELDVEKISKEIVQTFMDFYSLDSSEVDIENIIDTVTRNPDDFVLKPQREGGGNNIYGDDILKRFENTNNKEELQEYIVMKFIKPVLYKNFAVLSNEAAPKPINTIAELGVWGYYIVTENGHINDKEYFINKTGGYLLRSKDQSNKDGGVSSGRALLDTPLKF